MPIRLHGASLASLLLGVAFVTGCETPASESDGPTVVSGGVTSVADEDGGDDTVTSGGATTEETGGTLDPGSFDGTQYTKTFQPGVNGYESAKSVAISTLSAESYNGYQGTTFTDEVDWCIGDIPSYGYNESALMRFEDLGLPAGAKLTAATLTITFTAVNETGQKVFGRYLLVPWATSSGYGGTGVGWMNRLDGVPWGAPGARAEGVDYAAGKTFSYEGFVAGQTQTFAAGLDVEIVQSWVDDPAKNYGVILNVDLLDHHTGWRQPQNAVVKDRPILSLTYVVRD